MGLHITELGRHVLTREKPAQKGGRRIIIAFENRQVATSRAVHMILELTA